MKKLFSIFCLFVSFLLIPNVSFAEVPQGGVIEAFDIQPHVISVLPSGQRVTITFKITAYPSKLNAYCGRNDSIYWNIYEGSQVIKQDFLSVDPSVEGKTYQVALDNPFQLPQKGTSATRTFYALIECNTNTGKNIATSSNVVLTVQGGTGSSYACIANDGKYSCSTQSGSSISGNAPNCSTASGCSNLPCFSVPTSMCGTSASDFSYGYSSGPQTYICSPGKKSDCSDAPGHQNQSCVKIPTNYCGTSAPLPGTGTTGAGTTGSTPDKTYSFEITNPLKGGPNDLFDIINIATRLLLQISIPLAVLFILYAGFLMLTAGPTPAKYEKGKSILKNVVIGLAVIFIGRGFITLIYSILELGGSNVPTEQTSGTSSVSGSCNGNIYLVNGKQAGTCRNGVVTEEQVCVNGTWWQAGKNLNQSCSAKCLSGVCQNGTPGTCSKDSDCVVRKPIGGSCGKTSDCNSGLICQNKICQRTEGNAIGEPCVSGTNCNQAIGYACDNTTAASQVIDGQTLGSCYAIRPE